MKLKNIIEEFKKYSSPNFSGYPGTREEEIIKLEKEIKYKLPDDLKEFLQISNGAVINCHELYGIKSGIPSEDLLDNYIFETKEAGNPMPDYFLPFYPDGMGNHECLDLKSLSQDGNTCSVVFWQHDRSYEPDEKPDIDARSFTEYLEYILKEIEKEYNYDGSEK